MNRTTKNVARERVKSLLSRLFGAFVVVFAAVTVSFFAIKLIPGDPVDVILGPLATISESQKDVIRQELGLSEPVATQYVTYVGNLVRGDFGVSYQLGESVKDVLLRAIQPTVALTVTALIFAFILLVIGVLFARTKTTRSLLSAVQLGATTVPTFWLGFLLLYVFSFSLGWFPAVTSQNVSSLVLPAVAIAVPVAGILGQLLHSSFEDSASRPFWLSVRARGVSQLGFDVTHASKHALTSVLPLSAQIIGGLFAGTVIVEQVFSRPGVGSVALVAITNRDMPVVLGLVVLSAVTFVVLTLLADVLIWAIDPRVRAGAEITTSRYRIANG